MSYKAGSAYVSVLPDFRGFHEKIAAELKGMDGDFAKAGDRSGAVFGAAFRDRVRADIAKVPVARIRATADTASARRQLDDAARPRTAKIKAVISKTNLGALGSPLSLATLGGLALGPQALGLGAAAVGAGVAAGSAAAGLGAYAAIAIPTFKQIIAAQQGAATAQKALTKAQQQYDAATTKAGRAAALKAETTALQAQKAAVAGLTPAERELGTQMSGLESSWQKLLKAESPVVARSLLPWFLTAREGLRFVNPLFKDAASAVQDLGQEAEQHLASPFWGKFFDTLGNSGRIAITGFGDGLGHLADGFAHLFTEFAPDIDKLPGLMDKWSASFDRWAAAEKRSGLDNFLSKTFSAANIATLKGDMQDLSTLLGNAAKAGAGVSPTAFLGLSKVLEVLAKLSPGQIEALGIIFGIVKLGGGIGNIASAVGAIAGLAGIKLPKGLKLPGKGGGGGGSPVNDGDTIPFPGGGNDGATKPIPTVGSDTEPIRGKSVRTKLGDLVKAGSGETPDTTPTTPIPGGSTAAGGGLLSLLGLGGSLAGGTLIGEGSRALGDKLTPKGSFGGAVNAGIQASPASGGLGGSVFGGIATNLTLNAGRYGKDVASAFAQGWNGSNAIVSSAFGHAKGWVTGAFRGASSWLSGAGKSAATGLGSGYTRSAGWVGSQVGKAKGWATGAVRSSGSWLSGAGKSAASGLGSGFARASGAVTGAVGKAYGWVTGVFKGAGSWLWSAGRTLVSGMVNGVLSMGGSVGNALLSLVPSPVRSVVSKGLGLLGFASGTTAAPPGWAWVGERGPELMRFNGGEQVLPHMASVEAMRQLTRTLATSRANALPGLPGVSAPMPAGGISLAVSYDGPTDGAIGAIVKDLRFDIQHKAGGDVQQHLGRGKVRT